MNKYSFTHLTRSVLKHELVATVRHNRSGLAIELAYIAEFDDRKEYLPEGHPSMLSFCVHVLGFSSDSARKRIHAARASLRYPAIFQAVAEGQLNLSAVVVVAPYLERGNPAELLESVAGRTREEVDEILRRRFPSADQPMLAPVSDPMTVEEPGAECRVETGERAPGRVQNETVVSTPPTDSPIRAPWPVTVDPADHEKLRFAQSLLRHQIPNGDLTKVVSRLIDLGLAQLQKRKNGTGMASRPKSGASSNPRHIPSGVKARVWERDQGQCTFRSESGHRCPSREFLEYDHVVPVARGGMATVDNLRLRCHAHNQYEAERTFGIEFMNHKRESARAKKPIAAEPQLSAAAAEVIPWLRGLGFKIAEANAAAAICENMEAEPLEKRVRAALRHFKQTRSSGATATA